MSMRVSKGHSTTSDKHNIVAWSKETAGHIFSTKWIFNTGFYSQIHEEVRRRKWQATSVLLPGNFYGQRRQLDSCPCGLKELDTTEHAHTIRGSYFSGFIIFWKKKKKGRTSKIPNLKKKNLPEDNWHYFKIIVFLEKCCEGASWAFCGWGGQSLYEVCLVEDPKPHNCKQGFAWLHVHWPHRPRLFSALILYCWVVNSPYSGCSLVSNVRWPGAGRSQPPGGLRKLLSSEVLSYL